MRTLLAGLLVAASLAACASQTGKPDEMTPDSGPLAGTSWTATRIATWSVLEEHPATLEIDGEGRVSGKSGCNGFGGTVEVGDDSIAFSPLTSTMMACPDEQMVQEFRYSAALGAARGYITDGTTLQLLDEGGGVLVAYTRAETAPAE